MDVDVVVHGGVGGDVGADVGVVVADDDAAAEVDDDVDSDNDYFDLKELENDDDTNEDDDDERDEKMMVGKDLDDASDELYAEGGCRSMWGNRAGRRFGPKKKKKGGKRGG